MAEVCSTLLARAISPRLAAGLRCHFDAREPAAANRCIRSIKQEEVARAEVTVPVVHDPLACGESARAFRAFSLYWDKGPDARR